MSPFRDAPWRDGAIFCAVSACSGFGVSDNFLSDSLCASACFSLRPTPTLLSLLHPIGSQCGAVSLVEFRAIWQTQGMNPDDEQFPITLDDATKAKLDEAAQATGLSVDEVIVLVIETGLKSLEQGRQN
jgi:hypothetical protein